MQYPPHPETVSRYQEMRPSTIEMVGEGNLQANIVQLPRNDSDGLYGFDISLYIEALDWKKVLTETKYKYAFIEAARGTTQSKNFKSIWDSPERTIPCGPYQRICSYASGADQASAFVKTLQAASPLKDSDLPPVIDIEADGNDQFASRAVYTCIIDSWLEIVEDHLQREAIIYTNPSFCATVGFDEKYAIRKIWFAHYAVPKPLVPVPWKGYYFWQYAQDVNREAFGCTPVDLDYFGGDEAQLTAFVDASKRR